MEYDSFDELDKGNFEDLLGEIDELLNISIISVRRWHFTIAFKGKNCFKFVEIISKKMASSQ